MHLFSWSRQPLADDYVDIQPFLFRRTVIGQLAPAFNESEKSYICVTLTYPACLTINFTEFNLKNQKCCIHAKSLLDNPVGPSRKNDVFFWSQTGHDVGDQFET